ncbi:MAG TPA: hypothetical protein VFO27_19120, partial [Bryobacteraceae bacterium]|nr:hypothetical protein [Bryobacteraceae bacterium]
ETKDFALVPLQQLVECFRITSAGLRYDCGFLIDLNWTAHGGHRKTRGFIYHSATGAICETVAASRLCYAESSRYEQH